MRSALEVVVSLKIRLLNAVWDGLCLCGVRCKYV